MKNFPYEDAGIGTGLKFSIRHISKPLQGIKDDSGHSWTETESVMEL